MSDENEKINEENSGGGGTIERVEENSEEIKAREEIAESEKGVRDYLSIMEWILLPLQKNEIQKKALESFKNNIESSFKQVGNKNSLEECKVAMMDDKTYSKDEINSIKYSIEGWSRQIDEVQKTLTGSKKEKTASRKAADEITERRTVVAQCSIIYQQLKEKKVALAIKVLKEDQENKTIGENFEKKKESFTKAFDDASDYLKFLQTLERSIKDVSSNDLSTIKHTIEGIFHNLKIIYMISKHKEYNKFGALLAAIADEIFEKISNKIQLKELFSTDPDVLEQSIKIIEEAKSVASTWKFSYDQAKSKTQWDYSNGPIIDKLSFTEEKCKKLMDAFKKMQGYFKFFGSSLQKVINGSSDKITDKNKKIVEAFDNLKNLKCGIFKSEYTKDIENAFKNFENDIQSLQLDTQTLIDETFNDLKNAESAYELYQNIDKLLTEDLKEIKKTMENKYIKILESFKNDVIKYGKLFEDHKNNPPISKAKSPEAGKIAWARQIYVKMKKPISKIFSKKINANAQNNPSNTAPNNPNTTGNQKANETAVKEEELRNAFLDIATKLSKYEENIYIQWKTDVNANFMTYLRDHILTDKTDKELEEENLQQQKEDKKKTKDNKNKKDAKKNKNLKNETKPNDSNDKPKEYRVRFRKELKLMIKNTKFLDLYGRSEIPANIINIAHQETQLAKYCNMLNLMLKDYQNLNKSMKKHHRELLNADCNKLQEKIIVGTTTHNWTALGIEEFNQECMSEIKVLRDKFNNVVKSEEKINSYVKQIRNVVLVKPFDQTNLDNKDLSTVATYYEIHRKQVLSEMKNRYQDISASLIEIEKLTFETTGDKEEGCRKEMKEYYRYWEKCIYSALLYCIINSLLNICQLFQLNQEVNIRMLRHKMMDTSKKGKEKNALFIVKAKFTSSKEIEYNPKGEEVVTFIQTKFIKIFIELGKEFLRWGDGTCLEPVFDNANDSLKKYLSENYSYDTILKEDQTLKGIITDFYDSTKRINETLKKNTDNYTIQFTEDFFGHWGEKSKAKSQSELEKNKTLQNFEAKINEIIPKLAYFKKANEPKKLEECNFVLNNEELIAKGEEQVDNVINDILKILASDLEEVDMQKFENTIKTNKERLLEKTESSDELKKVLGYVSKILNKKLSMELKIHGMYEKIHFLKLHKYSGVNQLEQKFDILQKEWDNLRVKAKRKDDNLLERKKNLSKNTQKDEEILTKEVAEEYSRYKQSGPLSDVDLDTGYTILLESKERLKTLEEKKKDIVDCQKLFNLPITTFPEINDMIETNTKVEPIYKTYHDFSNFYADQKTLVWNKVDVNVLEKKVKELLSSKISFDKKGLQSYFPYKKFEDKRISFGENFEKVIKQLKDDVINERNFSEFIKELNMHGQIKVAFNIMTLGDVLNLGLIEYHEKVAQMVSDARKESEVKAKLDSIKSSLEGMVFKLAMHKRGNEDKGYKFKDVSEEMDIIKDGIQDIQSLGGNKHAKAFKLEINDLEQEMNNMLEIIEIWIEVQKKWIYLEAIFIGSEDIREKLGKQTAEFDENHRKFVALMNNVYKKPSIRVQCKESGRKMDLKNFLVNFEKAEKSLTEHLDSKKNEFSRFYFLTEQDLLQILGSSDPLETLNPHLIKIYTNCKQLLSDHRNIIGMVSQEGETYNFEKPIRIESQQQVGTWMNKVDDSMKSTLRALTKQAIQDYTKEELYKFIHNKLGMVTAFVTESWWTFALEDVFRRIKQEGDKYAMKKELDRQNKGLLDLIFCVRKKDISKNDRKKVNNLIIRSVHGKEIVDKFVRDSILDAREFEWESQLKYSWDKEKDDLIIRQCNGEFYSCYEYQGLDGRLVVTPLTDRCVMTITTALTFFLGCAPAGPAGTGKTETVKDLGRGLGIRVVVQNCSDTLDYLFMGQFFSGLSQTGFWGCFDEFNMINREVLSVVTTQINSIEMSLAQKKESWFLLSKEVKLLPTIGIFITMNPNYEGRSELPDNLKALFRPVSMVVPAYMLICENILMSFGFEDARKLACKIDKLYELSKEQLSKQHHYEWGLRSMKAVLNSAGTLKRMEELGLTEDLILLKAMKDLNMPKFIYDDAILFEGLLQDLFPNIDDSKLSNTEDNDIRAIFEEKKFKKIEGQILKVMQMYEVMNIRHCTMICGPPQSGKSAILEILTGTFEERNKIEGVKANVIQYIINPKAQSVPRLFGKKNEISDDFEIGILSNIFQIANAPIPNNKNELRWIICDGDIDPLWIEKLNSVMDDSKQLTLENKDRILMQKYCSMLVEAYNISHASPATISRLGMIYVDRSMLDGEAVFYRWLEQKDINIWDTQIKDCLREDYARIMPPALKYILKGAKGNEEDGIPFKLIAPQYQASMVKQLCNLIDACIGTNDVPNESSQLESLFIFCVVWSVGACLTSQEDRDKFGKFIKDLPSGTANPPSNPFGNLWDLADARFIEWSSESLNGKIIPETTGENEKYNDIIIPTSDTKKYSYLLKVLISQNLPVLFIGESGTGKTVTIQNYLKYITKDPNNPYLLLNMNFSSRTSSLDFQNTMEEILENRMLRTTGPPSGKKLIIYVDDLGMPNVDRFGTQQPIAFMKLLIEKNCYYTKDNKDLIKLIETNFIGSTLPPGGGNNNIDPRFIALFNVFNITIENDAVEKIYDVILTNYLTEYNSDDIMSMKEKLIKATVQLYSNIKAELPRTPIKFHYVFNIRDVSKVFQGFCLLTKNAFPNKENLVKLWRHECLRVFSDKLREPKDQQKVKSILESNIRNNFGEIMDEVLQEPCLHGDFMKVDFYEEEEADPNKKKEDIRFYENIPSYEDAKKFFDKALEAMKELTNQSMNLVFYDECVEHLLRIHRILRFQYGNALLVGVGGSGKQSLTKLATYVAKYDLWGIKITSKFEEKHLREQLAELFRLFIEQKPMKQITFLFTDEQVLDEGFLELINNILTTGIVPAIFEKPEKASIIDQYKQTALSKGLTDSKDVAYNLYVNRVRENLHMVLSMSPSGDNLRNRCRNFPGLISSTTIDWFFEWPKEALLQVAQFLFSEYTSINKELVDPICNHCITVHLSLGDFSAEALKSQKRNIYTTPKNFLDFIKNFQRLYKKNIGLNVSLVSRLEGGLQVISESSSKIDVLRAEVKVKNDQAVEKSATLQKTVEELNKISAETSVQKAEAEEKEKSLTEEGKIIAVQQKSIEEESTKIKKLIGEIEESVKKINRSDIERYGKMASLDLTKHNIVCIKCLVYSLNNKKCSFDKLADTEVKSVLMKCGDLFNKMQNLDSTFSAIKEGAGGIDQCLDAAERVKKFTFTKGKDGAIFQIQQYIINFAEFTDKQLKYVKLIDQLNIKKKQKAESEENLKITKEKLAVLTKKEKECNEEKEKQEKDLNETKELVNALQNKLRIADSLFTGLKSEEKRWAEDKKKLEENKDKLVGDCLLGASFLSYCGPFSFDFRERMIYDTWKADIISKSIQVNDNFKVRELLTSEKEISQWNIDGLPDDELSIQNGILTEQAQRWPLAIDPENQAVDWIKNKSGLKMRQINFNTENYMKTVNLAVRNGGIILIDNVGETIDPNINPVLEKNYITKNQVDYLILDGGEVAVSSDFKLFLITKLANPHYTPEIMAKATIINFSITMDGLQDQLLNEVVRHENSALEAERKQLVEAMNRNKIQLKEFEDKLLSDLNESARSGQNILDNLKLIETLNSTQEKATQIKRDLIGFEETKKTIYTQREQYKPVAIRGAILYFSISGLRLIGSMYEYSLESYINIYVRAIQDAPGNIILNNRLESIKKKLTLYLYDYICLSLFGKHKLMFSFHMRTMIMRYEENLDMNELLFFIRGSLTEAKVKKPDALDWLSPNSWQDLQGLSTVNDEMNNVVRIFNDHTAEWKQWFDLEKPENTDLPNGLEMRLSPLEKLCIIRVFRKDRVYNAIKLFIKKTTDGSDTYITPTQMKMDKIAAQAATGIPVLFILSPGVDPAHYVNNYAMDKGFFEKKYRSMSLGQKQELEATNMINDGIKRGLWILLQNCDLLFKWLKELEGIINGIDNNKPKPDFRLWLTTSPINNFPIGILHKSFKVVTEAPDGLGPNMNRVFNGIKPEEFDSDSSNVCYKPLVYVLSFFHSVLQDRKKFGKIGWNNIYDFMESDFVISKRLLSMYLNKLGPDDVIPWASLKYLIGEAMYGGRVVDDYDRRVMMVMLDEYMGDFVFDTNQKFYFARTEGFDYEVPEYGPIDNYIKAIDGLPVTYSPGVIGLHSNAEIDYFSNASTRIWDDMIKLQSSAGTSSKKKESDENAVKVKTKEEVVLDMANLFLDNKIPPKFDMLQVNKKFTVKTPIEAVLTQELERYNILIDKINDTLNELILSIKGEISMNSDIEVLMDSIYNGILPKSWRNLAPETQKNLLNWMEHLNKRYSQYKDWLDNGEPKSMWLSGLHIPASYLKAIIQTTCRKKGWPLDKVSTYTKVTKMMSGDDVTIKPEFGCYIKGMFLEGAEWSTEHECLEMQLPKKLICNMPLIQVIPAETSKIKLRNNLKTPVYMTQNRNNIKGEGIVFDADLKTYIHPNLWILQGVALILNIIYN